MDWTQIAEIVTAVGTWAVAGCTFWLVKGHLSTAKDERKIELYLELRKEFESEPLLSHREQFAGQLLDKKKHDEMTPGVLNFFEDLGMLLRRRYLDREIVWETFGHFAKMWWSSCRDYVTAERANMGGDTLFFGGFEYLVDQIYKVDVEKRKKKRTELEPSQSQQEYFLKTEARRPAKAA